MAEMYRAGALPGGLRNPIGGELLIGNPPLENPLDLHFNFIDEQTVEMTFISSDGETHSVEINTERFTSTDRSLIDQKIFAQYSWASGAIHHYYFHNDKQIPESIADLQAAGIWPFDGSEINYLTGNPLKFFSKEPGDLYFDFEPEKAKVAVLFSNNQFTMSFVPPTFTSN